MKTERQYRHSSIFFAISLVAFFATSAATCHGQNFVYRPPWGAMAANFAGGVCWGVHESTAHHYPAFQRTFPNAKARFWNPAESWKNKYQNGDPEQGPKFTGSTGALVFVTDAKHLFAAGSTLGTASAYGGYGVTVGIQIGGGKRKEWQEYLCDVALVSLSRTAGFTLFYNVIVGK